MLNVTLKMLVLVLFCPAAWSIAWGQVLGDITDGRVSMNAVQSLQLMQQQADEAYAGAHFQRAHELYMHLNQVGDKFAQFRIAAMYEDGNFVAQNLVEAYAWSFLAAETGRQAFRDYHQQIKARLQPDQLSLARERAGELVAEHGIFVQAIRAQQMLRNELKACTGSRVGNRCDAVSSNSYDCGLSADRLPARKCLRIGSLGLAAVAGAFPAQIRQVQNGLRDFIREYNPGSVELGDFELIADEKD